MKLCRKEIPLFLLAYRGICHEILKKTMQDIDRKVNNLKDSHLLNYEPVWIKPDFSSQIERRMKEIRKRYNTPRIKHFILIHEISQILHIEQSRQLACIEKAAKQASILLTTFQNPFRARYWKEVSQKWKQQADVRCGKIFSELGIHKVSSLSTNEGKFLSIKDPGYDCLDSAAYVFFKLRDTNMLSHCKNKQFNHNLYPKNSLMTLLGWDYHVPETPKQGDIVVYISRKNLFRHFGIYRGNGIVESKLRRFSDSGIYRHHIYSVPLNYGLKILFLRKSPIKIAEHLP